MNSKRILAVARKEAFHIKRDPFTLAFVLGLPVIMVLIFGLAIDFTPKEISLAIYDNDRSYESRHLTEVFTSSHFFNAQKADNFWAISEMLDSNQAKVGLYIPRDFQKVQVILDGSDSSTSGIVAGYISRIQMKVNHIDPEGPFKVRYLYNPELKSRWFIVPGLAVVVLSIISILLTSLTIAREWETGSMELLLSTPVSSAEIILGKLLPYIGLSLLGLTIIYGLARIFFGVPFVGNHLTFFLAAIMFLTTYLAMGILISSAARNQQLAMQFSLVAGLLPSLLLSGFIFPIESMPVFFHYFTAILPARWFMIITRGLFLQGPSLSDLWQPFTALLIMDFFFIMMAIKSFKRDLENKQ